MPPDISAPIAKTVKISLWSTMVFLALVLAILLGIAVVSASPTDFPEGFAVAIPSGSSLSEAAHILKEAEIIRSPLWFRLIVKASGGERKIVAGNYFFPESISTFTVSKRLITGDFGVTTFKITIPEGTSVAEIGKLFDGKFILFSESDFITAARSDEGFLFPDTYFLPPNDTLEAVVKLFKNNFEKKVAPLRAEIAASGKSEHDIVTMASLIEEEVQTPVDRRIVSGILWRRMRAGMRLQVDATFQYINGKGSLELTNEDLADSSPYNTYRYEGLPPGPISNPGLDAIIAALRPTITPYLYYLSDSKGVIHYAKTFEEHKKNRTLYLK